MRAVAEAGTISGVTRLPGTSQPAVSQQVRRLERRLGTALLERAGRSVRLTEAGAVLARHGAAVTAAVDAASEEVAALTGLRAGRVVSSRSPRRPRRSCHGPWPCCAPGTPASAQLTEAEPPEVLDEMRAGPADVAVSFTYEGGPDDDLEGLAVRPLLEDALWLATPAGHPVPAARPAEGFSPQVAYATDDDVAVLGLVAAGLGVAVVPGLVLATARRPDVDLAPLQPPSTRRVLAVTTPDLHRVPAVAAALDALSDAAGALAVSAAGAGSPGSATGRPT